MAKVPTFPVSLPFDTSSLRAAFPVKGAGQWYEMGLTANWLLGRGSSLVVAGPSSELSEGETFIAQYYVWPHEQCTFRVWSISLVKYTIEIADTCYATGTVTLPSGAVKKWSIDSNWPSYQPMQFMWIEQVDTPSSTPGAVSVTFVATQINGGQIYISGVACYETPRVNLTDGAAFTASNEQSLYSGQPILQNTNRAAYAVVKAAGGAVAQARRACQFSFWDDDGVSRTSTSYGDLFSADIPILTRHIYRDSTESFSTGREVEIAVFAEVTGASPNGQVLFTSANVGDSDSLTFTSGTPTWKTARIAVNSTDMARLDTHGGMRSAGREFINVQTRRNAGTAIVVFGLCIGEPES